MYRCTEYLWSGSAELTQHAQTGGIVLGGRRETPSPLCVSLLEPQHHRRRPTEHHQHLADPGLLWISCAVAVQHIRDFMQPGPSEADPKCSSTSATQHPPDQIAHHGLDHSCDQASRPRHGALPEGSAVRVAGTSARDGVPEGARCVGSVADRLVEPQGEVAASSCISRATEPSPPSPGHAAAARSVSPWLAGLPNGMDHGFGVAHGGASGDGC